MLLALFSYSDAFERGDGICIDSEKRALFIFICLVINDCLQKQPLLYPHQRQETGSGSKLFVPVHLGDVSMMDISTSSYDCPEITF